MPGGALIWKVWQGKVAVNAGTGLPCQLQVSEVHQASIARLPVPGCTGDQLLVIGDGEPPPSISSNSDWLSLRDCLGLFSESTFVRAGAAVQIAHWWQDHQYCSRCGSGLAEPEESALERLEFVRRCKGCDHHYYPRINPCIIVLVYSGERCLLARHLRSKSGVFTTLAGFVEPGENLEQAVAREVEEEVGLSVCNLSYQQSQSWPFPGQLMLGFYAEFDSGNIVLQEDEIAEADWFCWNSLPDIPPQGTISRALIDGFVEEQRARLSLSKKEEARGAL